MTTPATIVLEELPHYHENGQLCYDGLKLTETASTKMTVITLRGNFNWGIDRILIGLAYISLPPIFFKHYYKHHRVNFCNCEFTYPESVTYILNL